MEDNTMMKAKIEKLDLFPYFREFWNSTGDWKLISDKVKLQHLFMLKRFLSIQFPEMIQMINNIESARMVDSLHDMLSKPGGQSPGWMYTKTTKKVNDHNELLKKYSKYTLLEFKKFMNVSDRDFDHICKHYFDEAKTLLDEIEKGYNQKIRKRNAKK